LHPAVLRGTHRWPVRSRASPLRRFLDHPVRLRSLAAGLRYTPDVHCPRHKGLPVPSNALSDLRDGRETRVLAKHARSFAEAVVVEDAVLFGIRLVGVLEDELHRVRQVSRLYGGIEPGTVQGWSQPCLSVSASCSSLPTQSVRLSAFSAATRGRQYIIPKTRRSDAYVGPTEAPLPALGTKPCLMSLLDE